jgi:hypothetical protein
VAWSQTQPVQVRDALHYACGDAEEEGLGRRGRTELKPGGTEEIIPSTNGLR